MTKGTQPKTQKNFPTKPSAAALRAANALAGLATNTSANIHSVALIIDREMGAVGLQAFAELLEAAKQVLADLSDEEVPDADTVEMLEQAIAKAERSE